MVRQKVRLSFLCWCFGGGVTPVLFPNTEVKPSCADGSRKARVGRRQHRELKMETPRSIDRGVFGFVRYIIGVSFFGG